jgi:hypothetical protein
MEEAAHPATADHPSGEKPHDSLLRRKYVIPFLLACVILFCNTATGINSIIGYNTAILLQSGLSDLHAHWGYVLFTVVNFLMTMVGMMLVDRKGRRFLLILGTGGIIVSLIGVGILFLRTEVASLDARGAVQSMADANQELNLRFDRPKPAGCWPRRERRGSGSTAAGQQIRGNCSPICVGSRDWRPSRCAPPASLVLRRHLADARGVAAQRMRAQHGQHRSAASGATKNTALPSLAT